MVLSWANRTVYSLSTHSTIIENNLTERLWSRMSLAKEINSECSKNCCQQSATRKSYWFYILPRLSFYVFSKWSLISLQTSRLDLPTSIALLFSNVRYIFLEKWMSEVIVMCDYIQVQYKCGHLRFIVKAWCVKYQETHIRCPVNVVALWVSLRLW